MTRNLKGKGGLPDLKTYRYSFRLNEQQNAEFLKLQAQTGIGNQSKFILSRLFG